MISLGKGRTHRSTDITDNYCRHNLKIAFGIELIFIKRHHGRGNARARETERERRRRETEICIKRDIERARERERRSDSIDYSRNERTQRHINVSKDPTRAYVCGCIWRICGRARPETVVIPVLIRLPVKLLPGDRNFAACQPCPLLYAPPDNHNATRPRSATFVIIL